MPLPTATRGRYPSPRQLTPAQYRAIQDDISVGKGIRLAVLRALEAAPRPEEAFGDFCADEQLKGLRLALADPLQVGRAISKASFERHLRRGWFGSSAGSADVIRDLIDELQRFAAKPIEAAEHFRDILASGTPTFTPLKAVVSWYFFDGDSPSDACACIASNIAHRLALPDLFGKVVTPADARPYFVLVAIAENLDDPRRPRFTDCGEIRYLDVWRPGGRTAPWVSGCKGLDEVVAPPLAFTSQAVALAFVMCHEP